MTAVLIAHPGLGPGGSESGVLWSAQALRDEHRVTIATLRRFDLAAMNRHCGTDLAPTDLDRLCAPVPTTALLGHTDALRGALLARFVRDNAPRFPVCISGYNPLDFGRPGIQLLADFSFDDQLRQRFHPSAPGPRGWLHRASLARRGYLRLTRALAGGSGDDGVGDWLIANSHWTAQVLRERFGWVCERVIYPPVTAVPEGRPWEARECGFIVLGRISREKRIESLIDILARVRAAGHAVHLRIVGQIGSDAYGRQLRRRVAAHGAWCLADGYRGGADKAALLGRYRFALHGCVGEAFGIAVAEYVQAGCIPFVPRLGGPAEIVGCDALTFADVDEAVAKIIALLRDPVRQQPVRAQLAARAGQFSVARFTAGVRELVADWQAREGR